MFKIKRKANLDSDFELVRSCYFYDCRKSKVDQTMSQT